MNQRYQQQPLPKVATVEEAKSLLDVAIEATDMERLLAGRRISYVPQGETAAIELNVEMVKKFLVKPTKSGAMPSAADVLKFVMLCKAREMNPWVGDAYLVGYDGKDGPEYSLITSVHALHKRADRCPEYDGLTAGVIVKTADGLQEIAGCCYADGGELVGGWARVKRKDRSEPYYASLRLQSFDKGRSLWNSDKSGMVRKCAVAAALREAFPNHTSGLYTSDELPAMIAAANARHADDRPRLSEAARKAREDLDRMLDAPQSVGDDIAADAEKEVAEQTLPPTLDPNNPIDLKQDWLVRLRDCKTVNDVNDCTRDALENDGIDILQEGRDKLQAMNTRARGAKSGQLLDKGHPAH